MGLLRTSRPQKPFPSELPKLVKDDNTSSA